MPKKRMSQEHYDRVVAEAQAARRQKIERLQRKGIALNDEEWEEGEVPPRSPSDEDLAPEFASLLYPTEGEIAAKAEVIQRGWDNKVKKERAGVNAPVPSAFPKIESPQGRSGRGLLEDY